MQKLRGVAWLKKEAEAGNTYAQADLSQAYFYGGGVSEDKAEGFKWLFIATEISRSEYDRDQKEKMEGMITQEQFEQGRDLAIARLTAHGLVL